MFEEIGEMLKIINYVTREKMNIKNSVLDYLMYNHVPYVMVTCEQ